MTEVRSYHDQPVLKQPVWTWEVPCYFYAGGLAGASTGLAWLSELRGNDVLSRRAWGVALAATGVSPLLLTMDLGRPARFLNMLRMFKLTSPMSVGSWVLVANANAAAVVNAQRWFGLFPRLSRYGRPVSALLGLSMSIYTAALIANTAVPAWHEARRLLPFVFASGAAMSAGAAAVIVTPPDDAAPARRLALAGGVAEAVLRELMERRLGQHAEPYRQGAAFRLKRLSRAATVGGAAVLAARGRRSWGVAAIGGALVSAGALAARWSVFKAGVESAADAKYVVGPQRSLIEDGERRGASRRQAKVPAVDPPLASPATTLRR